MTRTPGDWELRKNGHTRMVFIANVDAQKSYPLFVDAKYDFEAPALEEDWANARMFAASAVMLEACKYAIDAMSGPDGHDLTTAEEMALAKLRNAVARVE